MILGTAAGLPVVACVATRDRWGHMVACPFCGETHLHGGHGPTSPAGAVNDARMSHCRQFGHEPAYYVLFEVPGFTGHRRSDDGMRVLNDVTYEVDRMPDLRELLAEFTAYYERVWSGLRKPGPLRMGHNYQPFLDGKAIWGYAYHGAGPVRPGTRLYKERKGAAARSKEVRRFWKFIDEQVKVDNWLASSILGDPSFPAEALDYDAWAAHLGAFAEPEHWERELDELWDLFHEGEPSHQRIQINRDVHLTVHTWRNYCVILVDRDALGWYAPDISDEVKAALADFEGPTLEMFKKLSRKAGWTHLANSEWYNLHVPIVYREAAISAMTAAEVAGDPGPLVQLLAEINRADLVASSTGNESSVEKVAIYQWTDVDGLPIYYGITKDMHSRQTTHARYGSWGAFASSCKVEWADTRDDALRIERELIERDRPVFNRQHNNNPEAKARVVEYLTRRGRFDLLTRL